MGDKTPDQLIPEQKQTENQTPQSETEQHSPAARLRKDQEALEARESLQSASQPQDAAPETGTGPDAQTETSAAPEGPRPEETGSDDVPLTMGQPSATDVQSSKIAAEFSAEAAPQSESQTEPQGEDQSEEADPAAASVIPADEPSPSRCFNALSWLAPLVPILLTIVLLAPLFYHSRISGLAPQSGLPPQLDAAIDKAKYGADLGFWFIPHTAGQPGQPDSGVLPMQLWWGALTGVMDDYLSGLAGEWINGWSGPLLLTWLFFTAVVCLGWTDSRFRRQAGLASGLAAFASLPIAVLVWFAPGLLLAPLFSVLASACLLRGLKKNTFSMAVFAGCICMALAVLSGGLIFAAVPLAAVLITIFGTLNFRHLGEWDLVFGVGLTVLLVGAWLTGALLFGGSTALRQYLGGLSLFTGGAAVLPGLPLACLLSLLVIILLPWLALPLLTPARSGKALLGGVKDWKNRVRFTEPLFMGGLALAGLAGLVAVTPEHPALFPLLLAAVIAWAVRSLTNLSPRQNSRWGAFCAVYLLLVAAGFLWLLLDNGRETLNAHLGIAANISFGMKTWLAPAVAAVIGALTMWFFGRGKSSQTGLLALAFAMLLLTQAFAWISLPVIQPYLKSTQMDIPAQDIVLPTPEILPDGPRLHLPLPPAPPVVTPPVPANHNATQGQMAQPDILGAPLPVLRNATSPDGGLDSTGATEPGVTGATAVNATKGAPEGALPAKNATQPVPDAGNAMYGDDLPPLAPPTGPPPAPYQPGLQQTPRAQEPPLPMLDTPVSAPAPAPRVDAYPQAGTN